MKVFLCTVLVAVFVAVSGQTYPKPSYKAPVYSAPAYSKPSYPPADYAKPNYPAYQKSYDAPMPYNFAWAVNDQPSYNDYSHQETADGNGYVSGSYRVALPDGRTQTVTYKADDYSGYVADVKYDGEAKYQEYKPSSYKPAAYPSPAYPAAYPAYPAYKPAYKPAYPAPAYPAPAYPKY